MQHTTDLEYMRAALALAAQAGRATSPNPRVGCVLVKDGAVIGRGYTQPAGQAHAEVQALRDAAVHGHDARGATAYVTLEPCSHFGRTPPCANALIEAGVARVVAALQDANPQVSGCGLALLRAAGIAVECGLLAEQARAQNLGFFKRMESGKPRLRMKVAASLDGRTALPNGHSQWITSPEARADGHHWRAQADAILTGSGTVLADDPQMNVRGQDVPRQPLKVVLDSGLRTPPAARVLAGGACLIVHAVRDATRESALQQAGAETLCLAGADGRVDLEALLLELGRRQINDAHVEAGARLNGALLAAGAVDELLLYLAPKLLGSGAGMFDLPALHSIAQAPQLLLHEVGMVGPDVRILARFPGR